MEVPEVSCQSSGSRGLSNVVGPGESENSNRNERRRQQKTDNQYLRSEGSYLVPPQLEKGYVFDLGLGKFTTTGLMETNYFG